MKQSPQQTTHPFLDLDAEPILQIVALFQQRAEQMKFPDVDAATLSAALAQVESQHDVVEAAAVALDEARQALLAKELALLAQAHRAHAYATIFAANDEQLAAELGEIKLNALGKGAKSRDVKKRRALPQSPRALADLSSALPELSSAEPELPSALPESPEVQEAAPRGERVSSAKRGGKSVNAAARAAEPENDGEEVAAE